MTEAVVFCERCGKGINLPAGEAIYICNLCKKKICKDDSTRCVECGKYVCKKSSNIYEYIQIVYLRMFLIPAMDFRAHKEVRGAQRLMVAAMTGDIKSRGSRQLMKKAEKIIEREAGSDSFFPSFIKSEKTVIDDEICKLLQIPYRRLPDSLFIDSRSMCYSCMKNATIIRILPKSKGWVGPVTHTTTRVELEPIQSCDSLYTN